MVKSFKMAEPVLAKAAPTAVELVCPDVWSHFKVTGCIDVIAVKSALSCAAVACKLSTVTLHERVTLTFCDHPFGVSFVDSSSAFPV
jgi:hypothetical protein